ncbi:dihydroneopterin aldolase [Glycomyces sp. NRRL B-16210]|uniref:dihydroneopterin aldolase n=1 Tax=Glycomyces sp. NRRL B-16210 TaxID=1463821 RepID=UPI0009E017B6|nr:dihydroneopterin aldolase [Glycomyces sp. NRRL B-16210]
MDTDDLITLTGLRVHGRHGVFAHEREAGQDFIVDVALRTSTAEAAASDDLEHTVDYGTLADTLADIVAGEPVNLIETLAERLADACVALDRVRSAKVTVHKPQAPIAQQFTDVSVTVERSGRRTARGGADDLPDHTDHRLRREGGGV